MGTKTIAVLITILKKIAGLCECEKLLLIFKSKFSMLSGG
jgi:hypothetical protein